MTLNAFLIGNILSTSTKKKKKNGTNVGFFSSKLNRLKNFSFLNRLFLFFFSQKPWSDGFSVHDLNIIYLVSFIVCLSVFY